MAPPPRHGRVVALTAVLAAASAGLWTLLAPAPRPASAVGVVLLVAAAIAVDWWPLTLEHRGQTLHQTLSGIVVVFGLLFVSPVATLAARACGTLVGYRFRWRAAPIKIAYNGVLATLEVWVAAAVLAAVAGGAGPLRPQAWLGIATALLAAELISFLLVLGVIRLTAGALRLDVVGDMVVALLYTSAISAAVAIPGAVVLAVEPAAAVALAAVVGLVARTNRARHALSERYRNLTSLYAFIDATTTAAGDVIPTLLAEAVRATGADRVTLLLAGGDAAAAYHLGAEGEPVRTTPADRDGVAALALSAPAGRLLARGEPRPLPALTGPPADQALLVSLSQGSLRGALLLEGRRGTLPDFDETDLQLARGMARHAAQALVTSRLVDELQASTETMERLALFDRDTGLPSRAGLLRSGVDVRGTVLALVEIGELDTVEGTFGHRAAGTVIKALADRLADADALGIRAAARVADDRFAVLLHDDGDEGTAHQRVLQLRAALQAPVRGRSVSLDAAVLVGAASADAHDLTGLAPLLRAATSALSQARQSPADGIAWFDPSIDARASARIRMASDLREAIADGGLSLVFQPKVELASGRLVGVEALCRWIRPDGRTTSPVEFIDIAERTGLIGPLTEWVVDAATAQAGRWRAAGLDLDLAINISPEVLRDPAVVRHLVARCEAAGVPASSITVEITESLMMGDAHHGSGVLRVLDEAGIRISVDDFGVGWSSLAQLKDLPVDEVKIDRSFVRDVERSREALAITEAIIAMAHRLDLEVVAEGVETPGALVLLRDAGCRVAQGHLLGRPVPAHEITARASAPPPDREAGASGVVAFRRSREGA